MLEERINNKANTTIIYYITKDHIATHMMQVQPKVKQC